MGEYAALAREISRSVGDRKITICIASSNMEGLVEALSKGSVDVVLGRWGADYPDADTFATSWPLKRGCWESYVVQPRWTV
jgi:hypothetical protein